MDPPFSIWSYYILVQKRQNFHFKMCSNIYFALPPWQVFMHWTKSQVEFLILWNLWIPNNYIAWGNTDSRSMSFYHLLKRVRTIIRRGNDTLFIHFSISFKSCPNEAVLLEWNLNIERLNSEWDPCFRRMICVKRCRCDNSSSTWLSWSLIVSPMHMLSLIYIQVMHMHP